MRAEAGCWYKETCGFMKKKRSPKDNHPRQSMTRDGGSYGRTSMRGGGMNNDPCVYHVIFLLNVGDRDEGGR